MLIAYFAFFAIVSSVSAAPGRYKSYPYGFPFSGAFAAAGFPFFQPYQPYPWLFPMPDFNSMFMPWYKGQNVCETKKVMDEPEEMKEWLSEGFSDSGSTYNHESESCRGNNEKYVCMKRINTNEGSKMEMVKYECCFGFVRSTDGTPGCVESSGEQSSSNKPTGAPSTSRVVKMSDRMSYNYFKSSPNAKKVANTPAEPNALD